MCALRKIADVRHLRLLTEVTAGGRFPGKKEFLTFLNTGKKLFPVSAIKAFCYQCMGYGDGGRLDCRNPLCPLYPHNPLGTARKEEKAEKKAQAAKSDVKVKRGGFKKKDGATNE